LGVLLKQQDDIADIQRAKARRRSAKFATISAAGRRDEPPGDGDRGGQKAMAYDFELTCSLPAPPETVYDAWLSSAGHSAMTGAKAKISERLGAAYSAWDGYISGKTLELVPGRRIVQSWRTTEFSPEDPDSTITIDLVATKSGTKLTLTHRGAPDGQTSYETEGWRDYYFAPMVEYFSAHAGKGEAAAAKKKG
jgi:uncharacterized protein YndB with AHSA1/START domain